jgi:TetR/AcrR family transcriptional regulator
MDMSHMVTARRKEIEKERRRSEIVDAAEELFFSKGYDGVSMDDVAKRTELAKGTLYLYFTNKESLFFAVVQRGMLLMNTMFEDGVKKAKLGADKLYSTGVSYYNFYKQYPDYFKLLSYSQSPCFTSSDAQEIDRLGQNNIDIMCECIRTGQADGSVRKDIDPLKTALFLIFSSESIIKHTVEMKDMMEAQGISPDDFVAYSLDLMGTGIAGKKWGKSK